ncbi:MAG: ribonuclease PH [Actinomycetaceae bacterium]|nr:ribonuclease PH [Actinomycetaceae bacterium]
MSQTSKNTSGPESSASKGAATASSPAAEATGTTAVNSASPTSGDAQQGRRKDGRALDELRPIKITRNWIKNAEGSCLIEFGSTRVLCVASLTEGVPRWRTGSGEGWVTAEYAMLPRATSSRSQRESVRGKIGGRTHEISRLIGRSLRAVVDVAALGENTIVLDCDVLQADGGTRTAAITGAYIALADAVKWGQDQGLIAPDKAHRKVLSDSVAAISVGIIDGVPMLDLPYEEDVRADTDMNVVMTGSGSFVEVQGTAEGAAFDRAELGTLLDLAETGCRALTQIQQAALAGEGTVLAGSAGSATTTGVGAEG